MESISEALFKSGQLGLDFRSWAREIEDAPTAGMIADLVERQEEYWRFVLTHRNRWRTVNFQFIALSSTRVPADLRSSMTTSDLKEFSIVVFQEGEPPAGELDLLNGYLPNLRRLVLQIVPIKWSEFFAPNLHVLRLIDITHFGPSLLQLHYILDFCPILENIVIKSVWSLQETPAPTPECNRRPVVRLDRLRKIVLSHITPESTRWLLEAIQIPSECSVVLESDVDRSPETTLLPSHVPDLRAKCLKGASRILIKVRWPSVRLRLDGLWDLYLRSTNLDFARDMLLWLGVAESATESDIPIEMKWDKFAFATLQGNYLEPISGFQSICRHFIDPKCAWALSHFLQTRSDGVSVSFPGIGDISVSTIGCKWDAFKALSDVITNRRHEPADTADRLGAIKFEVPKSGADQAQISVPLGETSFVYLLKLQKG
ncbi:hypothetical protein FRB90_002553 [Tulasnella sp. 427]|nr:hypothetical protein FRB90_002553 [Tulasnella sp. 427]